MKCSHCDGTGIEPPASLELAVPDGPDRFDEFWQLYDRTGPRKKAKECWDAALRRGHSPETILAGLARWVAYWRSPGSAAVKWPQGFLNQEYFLELPPQIRSTGERKAMPGRSGIEAALANRRRNELGDGS